jgi:heterodisulfide reductase subunit A
LKIGVYVCECGINISATVDVGRVVEEVGRLQDVAVARHYKYMCSNPGQNLIKEDIREYGLDRVVVASCSPRMHEPTFRAALREAGLNEYCLEMVNIREHCSWVHEDREAATKKAIALVMGAVARAAHLQPLEKKEVPVTPTALVIGGGIAGIQAALELADNGFKTYLVERSPSIGGHMAQLEKTFPTLDCAACILTPKMVDVARHPNIELITYAEVEEVDGYIGNFKVKIRKKPRYVDPTKCVGCGMCADACRMRGRIPSEFELGLGKRGAIYIPFPQAVPRVYVIDPEACLYLRYGKCGETPRCAEVCPRGAVNFDDREEVVELEVGAIVVATGFDMYDPSEDEKWGYDGERVITGLEFERLCSASGPTGGKITICGKTPERIVFIQCVGSRERGGREYCSRVCCMYTAKHAHLIKEKIPDAEVFIYYTDVRAFGKGFEEFYNRVKDEGAIYIRRELDDEIRVLRKGEKVIVKCEGHPDMEAALVVLATAIVPREDAARMASVLNISRSGDGFFLEAHPKLRPVETLTDGIFLAGACQGPKDIPDTVAQASGAAEKAAIPLARGKVEVEAVTAVVDEEICSGCRICEGLCPYSALNYDAEKGVMSVNDVLCKGCGTCASACPSGAMSVHHYTAEQILAQIDAMVEAMRQ